MKRVLSVVLSVAVMIAFTHSSLMAAKYKYVYKNGKKYKVKVRSKSGAKYKYVYKNGKKYKVRVKSPSYKRSTPKYSKYKYVYKNGKKYRVKKSTTPKRSYQKADVNVRSVEEMASKSRRAASSETKPISIFGYVEGMPYAGVNLVSRSTENDYSISTKNVQDSDGNGIYLTHPAAGEQFLADGSSYSFSNSESATSFDFRGGIETKSRDKIEANLFYGSDEIDLGLGYKYLIPSFSFYGVDPYLKAQLSFVYKDLSDLTGIMFNTYSLGYGIGGEYTYNEKMFLNFGIDMSSKTWAEESTTYTTENRDSSDTDMYLGVNYRF